MSAELQALISLLSGGGPYLLASVFAYLWWNAKEELKVERNVTVQLLERCLNALNGNANALGDLRVYMGLNRTDQGRQ